MLFGTSLWFPKAFRGFPELACFAVTRLSMALPPLYVPRYGFPGSLPWLATGFNRKLQKYNLNFIKLI